MNTERESDTDMCPQGLHLSTIWSIRTVSNIGTLRCMSEKEKSLLWIGMREERRGKVSKLWKGMGKNLFARAGPVAA